MARGVFGAWSRRCHGDDTVQRRCHFKVTQLYNITSADWQQKVMKLTWRHDRRKHSLTWRRWDGTCSIVHKQKQQKQNQCQRSFHGCCLNWIRTSSMTVHTDHPRERCLWQNWLISWQGFAFCFDLNYGGRENCGEANKQFDKSGLSSRHSISACFVYAEHYGNDWAQFSKELSAVVGFRLRLLENLRLQVGIKRSQEAPS